MSTIAFSEMLILLSLSGGTSNDLVSWVSPDLYFGSREIALTAGTMSQIAGKVPTNNQEGVARLLAIRWLGENRGEVAESKAAREVLEALAREAKNDALGFARTYARRALSRLDGKPIEADPLPANSVRADALSWFPQDVTFVFAGDVRRSGDAPAPDLENARTVLMRTMPPTALGHFYDFVDSVGNLRVDRVAFAYSPGPKDNPQQTFFIRLTGLGDHKALAEFIRKNAGETAVKDEKTPDGKPITIITNVNRPPAFALIGNTDLIIAGPEGRGDSGPVLRSLLDVVAGKKPSVTTGPLAARLKEVPAQASLLAAGDVPAEVRRELLNGDVPILAPQGLTFHVTSGKALASRFSGSFADEGDARKFVQTMEDLRKKGLQQLPLLPPAIVKRASVALFRKALEEVKFEADGKTGKVSADLPPEILQAAVDTMVQVYVMESTPRPSDDP